MNKIRRAVAEEFDCAIQGCYKNSSVISYNDVAKLDCWDFMIFPVP